MAMKMNAWIKITPWFIGFLLSTAGMFLGYNFGSDTASLLGGEPGIWARMCKGLVWGGIISGLQWPIVRVIGVSPIWFIAASAIGFGVGYPFGQTIQATIIHHWSLNYMGYWLAVAAFGLFLGVPQWWILHRHMQRASLWILFSVIGWVVTGAAWISFGGSSGVDSVLYGIVTGLGLVWLVHFQQSKLKGKDS
jgi:hypothetical protein